MGTIKENGKGKERISSMIQFFAASTIRYKEKEFFIKEVVFPDTLQTLHFRAP